MKPLNATTRRTPNAWWHWAAALVMTLVLMPATLQAGIAVTPLKRELSLRPGEQGVFDLQLTYNSRRDNDQPDSGMLSLADLAVDETGSLAFPDPGTEKDSASKWVQMEAKKVSLRPGESHKVRCTVTPPMSAAPGEYYCVILVTLGNQGKTEQGVAVQFRIATGVFVTVLGRTLPKAATITRCELEWPESEAASVTPSTAPTAQTAAATTRPAPRGQPRVALVIANTGKARFEGVGKMLLLNERGQIAYSTPLVSSRAWVFPGDTRRFEALLTKPLPEGRYTARVTLDYGSAWSKARQELPVEITSERAQLLASTAQPGNEKKAAVKVTPERLTPVMPAGATRSLALAVTNSTEVEARCVARLVAEIPSPADEWITIEPDESQIAQSERKSLRLQIHVPPGTPAGKYVSNVTIQTRPEGAEMDVQTVPVEIEVLAEKSHG